MVDLEQFKLNKLQRFGLKMKKWFKSIPSRFKNFFTKKIPNFFKRIGLNIKNEFVSLKDIFKKGDYKTRTSFFIMGFGQLARKQILRGIIFLSFEILFFVYMIGFGWKYLALLGNLGNEAMVEIWNEEEQIYEYVSKDNSMLILLYSLITFFIIFAFIYVWRLNVKQNGITQELEEIGIKPKRAKDDLKSISDSQYHKTLLAIPTAGLLIFTILPMIFMVLIAFTNWDAYHYPPKELFTWVAFDNFIDLFGGGVSTDSKLFFYTFRQVLLWTFIWAIFATFTNYFLGMIVAMLINKKGIKFKKLWRSILVFTIAVPQFVSLLLISQMLQKSGAINVFLQDIGWIKEPIPFLTSKWRARITVIVVNIWVGIPYTMLICTGILMNIPDDLYESAKIDGASPVRMYFKITLPYMLFVTGPYLLSQFIGNINNFNVIYLLSGGAPNNLNYQFAGETDLLITWLYKLTLNNTNYKMAAVIGIVVFIIIAVISLPFYSKSNAVNNEEDFR